VKKLKDSKALPLAQNPPAARVVGFDMLRCLACVMVVLLHASAQHWYALAPTDPEWIAMHVWNTATRAAVPIFFMISGALFLNAPAPTKKLWTRNIPRLLSVFAVWSALYGIDTMTLPGVLENPLRLLDYAMEGKYHLWFLPAMIGVYLLLPALYAIAHYEGGRALRPYLWVFGIFGIVCGTVAAFDGMLPWAVSVGFAKVVPELCGYAGYFILGYALTKVDASCLRRWMLLLIFAGSAGIASAAGILYSRHTGAPVALLHGDFTVTTFFEAVSLFLLFRTVKTEPDSRCAKVFGELSACTLGIYLLHPFVMELLLRLGFGTMIVHGGIGTVFVTVVVTAICLCTAAVLRRIPAVGKWIV